MAESAQRVEKVKFSNMSVIFYAGACRFTTLCFNELFLQLLKQEQDKLS